MTTHKHLKTKPFSRVRAWGIFSSRLAIPSSKTSTTAHFFKIFLVCGGMLQPFKERAHHQNSTGPVRTMVGAETRTVNPCLTHEAHFSHNNARHFPAAHHRQGVKNTRGAKGDQIRTDLPIDTYTERLSTTSSAGSDRHPRASRVPTLTRNQHAGRRVSFGPSLAGSSMP